MASNQLDVGQKLRQIREEKKLTINHIAKETGFTSSFISQLERGLTKASVSSLQKIASSLDTNLSDLFEEENQPLPPSKLHDPVIVKKSDRRKLVYPDDQSVDYLLTGLEGQFEVIYSEIEPGGSSGGELISHNSVEECITVLNGDMEITIGEDHYILHKSDTITFSSHIPHGWKNIGSETLKLIWVVTPPTY